MIAQVATIWLMRYASRVARACQGLPTNHTKGRRADTLRPFRLCGRGNECINTALCFTTTTQRKGVKMQHSRFNLLVDVAPVLAVLILVGCGPSPEAIQSAIGATQAQWTPVPTQTPYLTYTPAATYTPYPTYTPPPTIAIEVTRIVIVTPTATETPLYTPTVTPTPTKTPNAAKTATAQAIARLIAPKGDGFYLVNVDIAPGVWLSKGTQDNCYWARTRKNGDIIDNHLGLAGGTMYIAATDFQVQMQDCGRWTYIGPP